MGTKIFDLHCDTLDRLAWPLLASDLKADMDPYALSGEDGPKTEAPLDFKSTDGHLSLDNMASFDWAQCLAIFIPDELDVDQSARFFETVSNSLPYHVAQNPELLEVASVSADISRILDAGRTCGILTIENAKLLAASDEMFDTIAKAGVKMVTLTWNAANPLGSGHDTQQGLTDFGRRAVRELEDRKIIVDVSHLNDPGFEDLTKIARRPFVASHSCSRAICDVPRNLTDDQFRFIRDAGGIVGLNFCKDFVSTSDDPTPQELLAHIEHWLDLGGSKTVALGSDYDGCSTPSWLAPCTQMATLADLLHEHFGDTIANRILFENAHDFFVRNDLDDTEELQKAAELESLF